MNRRTGLGLTLVIVTSAKIIVGCGGGYSTPQSLPISVTISSVSSNTVQAGGAVSLTAQVANDSSNRGVTWMVACPTAPCGSISPTTTSNGAPTTYTAPNAPPANQVVVTITATSMADTTKSVSASVDFATNIAVAVSASLNPVGAGGTSQVSAVVTSDPANKGVDPNSWTISPATGAGTLSSPTSRSVVYTAPATPPANDVQVTVTATSISDPNKTGNVGITFAAIAVFVSASSPAVPAQGASTITATVNFDPLTAGVNPASWTISPTTGGGSLSGGTSTTVTYTAPSTPPSSNLPVTITAAAASDSSKSGSTSVTVLALVISVTPASALIPVNNGAQQFTALIQNDPAATPQANWTIEQNGTPCASSCGALSTASGAVTTYTPPSTVPANSMVTLRATSATDTTKTASAAITLTNGTVQVVPADLNFGNLNKIPSRILTTVLTNAGGTALAISNINIAGKNPIEFSLTGNTCGASVAGGASCQLTVTFKPRGSTTYNAILSIQDSSTDSPQQVTMEGSASRSRFNINQVAVDLALATNKAPSVPAPTGPSAVGTRLLDLLDVTRNDPFLANGTKRELLVRVWYPTQNIVNCRRAEYTSNRVWNDFSRLSGVALPQVTTNSCWNASMTDGSHPVLVFTHGFTGTFTDYTFLFEDLASRGYVVASVDHTFEATAVEFPDGRFVESVFGSHLGTAARSDDAAIEFAVSVRLRDLEFVVDELELLNSGADADMAGKMDMSRVALAGHSLGGLTTILGVEKESRFHAGVVLDGVMPKSSMREIETPMLIVAAGRESWTNEEEQLWSSLHGPRLAVNLRGAEHVAPSDLVWLAAGAVEVGPMGAEKTMAAVRNYIAAFLEANLMGKTPSQLLKGPSSEYRDAIVTLRNQTLRAKD